MDRHHGWPTWRQIADYSLVGVLLVSRNLAYLSRMQSTIAYSQKLVALGRLTASIAHELRTPLTVLRGEAEIALMQTSSDAGHRQVLVAFVCGLEEHPGGCVADGRSNELMAGSEAVSPTMT